MNRRAMFKALVGGAAVVTVATNVNGSEIKSRFKGWSVRWTGWKNNANSADIAGQFIAGKLDKSGNLDPYYPLVYSSCPGFSDVFFKGDTFNIGYVCNQMRVDGTSSEADKLKAQVQTWQSLKYFMDNKILKINWTKPTAFTESSVYSPRPAVFVERQESVFCLPVNRLRYRHKENFWEDLIRDAPA